MLQYLSFLKKHQYIPASPDSVRILLVTVHITTLIMQLGNTKGKGTAMYAMVTVCVTPCESKLPGSEGAASQCILGKS